MTGVALGALAAPLGSRKGGNALSSQFEGRKGLFLEMENAFFAYGR